MDNNQQNISDQSQTNNTSSTPPQNDFQQQQSQATQSYHPSGSLRKENELLSTQEAIGPSEKESQPTISKELQEAGVEASKDREIQLSVEDQLAGLAPAKESVPMAKHIAANMQFPQQPYTQEEAVEIIKNSSPGESKHWLAVLVLAILHKLHVRTKKQHEEAKLALVEKAA